MNTATKTVATAAVEAINAQTRSNAEASAIVLVKRIVELNNRIKSEETDITDLQKRLGELANSEITLAGVYGKPMPAALTETQKTVAKAIETLVKGKQGCVEARATELGQLIVSKQSSIAELEKQIHKSQEELDAIKVEAISEADVLS